MDCPFSLPKGCSPGVKIRTATPTGTLSVIPVDSVTPQVLAGTEGAAQPLWSPDSRSIAFFAGRKLKKVRVSGGPPQEIGDARDFAGGAWNREGTIVFGSTKGLHRVSAEGGKPEAITALQQPETGHFWPRFLPDGRHYLYLAWSGQSSGRAIFAGTLDSKDKTRIMAAESQAAYAAPGFLLFHRERTVYAQSFNPRKLALAGEVRVADEITFSAANAREVSTCRKTAACCSTTVTARIRTLPRASECVI